MPLILAQELTTEQCSVWRTLDSTSVKFCCPLLHCVWYSTRLCIADLLLTPGILKQTWVSPVTGWSMSLRPMRYSPLGILLEFGTCLLNQSPYAHLARTLSTVRSKIISLLQDIWGTQLLCVASFTSIHLAYKLLICCNY